MSEVTELDLKNKSNKGGRPVAGYIQSFNFILPKNTIKPTQEQWKAISRDLFKVLAKDLDIKPSELKKNVFINLHDQDNPHINLAISKVINGTRIRKVDQKSLLSKLKTQFNNSVLQHCDYDYRSYKPTSTEVGKRTDKWLHSLKLLTQAQKQFKALADYIDNNNQKRVLSTENRIAKTLCRVDYSEAEKAFKELSQTNNEDFNNSIENIKEKMKKIKPK